MKILKECEKLYRKGLLTITEYEAVLNCYKENETWFKTLLKYYKDYEITYNYDIIYDLEMNTNLFKQMQFKSFSEVDAFREYNIKLSKVITLVFLYLEDEDED